MSSKKNIVYVAKKYTPSPSQTSTPPIKVQLPFYYNLVFILFWILFVYSVTQYLMALYFFHPYIKWWNDNNGSRYNRVFSIRLFAQYDYFRLGSWFNSLFVSEYAKIQSEGIGYFITNMIVGFAKINQQDQIGVLYPKHFCESIVVGDRKDRPSPPEWIPYLDPDTNYPITEHIWRELLISWGAPSNRSQPPDSVKWRNQTDNFLWNIYRIDVSSEFILSFITNSTSEKGEKWFPYSFLIAVGINRNTGGSMGIDGGWWGFVRYGFETEKDLTLATIYNCLYGTTPYTPTRPRSCKGQYGSIITTSILSGGATSAGLFAFLVAGTGPIGISIAISAGVLSGTASLISSLRNCNP